MMHWIWMVLLACVTGCSEMETSVPPRAVPSAGAARPVAFNAPRNPRPAAPIVATYPGGTVQRVGNVLRSEAMGRARGNSPRDRLMARRAAYLIAVRNAGLFLAGLRSDPGGQLRPGANGTLHANLTVRNFREVASRFDPDTRTAWVTIEVDLAP